MEEEPEIIEIKEDATEFTLSEIVQMEKLCKEMSDDPISPEFYEELCSKFNATEHRSIFPITSDQVRSWFQEKRIDLPPEVAHSSLRRGRPRSRGMRVLLKRSKVPTISASQAVAELPNLMFEARSAKDYAWFDVACFLSYRVLSGELSVRVRFAGFGKEEDEWVTVKTDIRERSVPLDPSECNRVDVGDRILCYRDSIYHALYYDARIVEIERNSHESNPCTCVFLVHYDVDNFEEKVSLEKLCYRPNKMDSKVTQECKPEPELLEALQMDPYRE